MLEPPLDPEIAQKTVPFQAQSVHVVLAGKVRVVQLEPFVEVANVFPEAVGKVTNVELFATIRTVFVFHGNVCAVHGPPSAVAVMRPPAEPPSAA